ncbi:hypothetical protein [Sinomonas gamaensis]|uniref:hypothetical protein n=1 Tax=Sinomonas gamaensis TaxID=2565624 RepID=UPI001486664D|nr:hypothetical protein [Sinomonas gamaensis]
MAFRLYLISMTTILGIGIVLAVVAPSPSTFAIALASVSIGAGGISSGIVSRLTR